MGRLLELGLSNVRANGEDPAPIEGLDTDQAVQLFEAIKALTSPMRGGVDRVEIGGELIDSLSGSKVLTRDDRLRSSERIKAVSRALRKEAPFRVAGVVEEADQGTFSFTLCQLDPTDIPVLNNASEVRFGFEDRLLDAVSDAWNSQERVFVIGERIGAAYKALDIQVAGDATPGGSEGEGHGSE